MRDAMPRGWQAQQHGPPPPHAHNQRIVLKQGSFARAASPLAQHVTTSPPMGVQGLHGKSQVKGPYAPPGAS